jgi:alpha-N-acetylgalactosaminidase
VIVSSAPCLYGLENGLARTPPMGWLSWERFGCNINCAEFPDSCISERLYADMADKLVELGLSEVGYKYVNIDDCWSVKERPSDGKLTEDPLRFPKGMRWLSDYIHSKGLKFGMYTDIGSKTCGAYPGLDEYMEADVWQFANDWQIDSLKVDGCYANVSDMSVLYSKLSDTLNRTGRPILYSCSWPAYQDDHCENFSDMNALVSQCNLWRNWDDIQDSWQSVRSIMDFFARTNESDIIVQAAGPGHWNDPDMLLVGNPGVSLSEQRAQFAVWAILAAPLYISADLRTIAKESLEILSNQEIIAVNQDPLGKQGFVILDSGNYRIWKKILIPNSINEERVAIVFENKATIFEKLRFFFSVERMLGWSTNGLAGSTYSVRDLFLKTDVRVRVPVGENFVVDVDESSVEMYVFTRHLNKVDELVVVEFL